jgi:hypothetical protein
VKKYENLIDYRKAENFFQLNRDMTLLERYGENTKDVQKYLDRLDLIDQNIIENLDISKKLDFN